MRWAEPLWAIFLLVNAANWIVVSHNVVSMIQLAMAWLSLGALLAMTASDGKAVR